LATRSEQIQQESVGQNGSKSNKKKAWVPFAIKAEEIKDLVSSSEASGHHAEAKERADAKRAENVLNAGGIFVISEQVDTKDSQGDKDRKSKVQMLVKFLGDVDSLKEMVVASEGSGDSTKSEDHSGHEHGLLVELRNAVKTEFGETSFSKFGSQTDQKTSNHELNKASSLEEKLVAFERLDGCVGNFFKAKEGDDEGSSEKHTSNKTGSPLGF